MIVRYFTTVDQRAKSLPNGSYSKWLRLLVVVLVASSVLVCLGLTSRHRTRDNPYIVTGLSLTPISSGQQPKVKALDQEVRGFELRDVLPSLVLERVAKSRNAPIGFEAVPRENNKINVIVERGTLRNILDQIVQADSRYEWKEADGVINVSPRLNKSPILETVVASFSVEHVNSLGAISAVFELPEVRTKVAQMDVKRRDFRSLPGKTDYSGPQFSLKLRNVTVRRILNEIMKAGGDNYWVFFRYGDHDEYFSVTSSG